MSGKQFDAAALGGAARRLYRGRPGRAKAEKLLKCQDFILKMSMTLLVLLLAL